jgi:hypothetical protein
MTEQTKPNTPQQSSRKPNTNKSRKNRARYDRKKRNKRAGKQGVAQRKPVGPVKQYLSACCSLPAIKPRCGQLEAVINPETKKSKEMPKGLGHWRCTGCRKATKVTPQVPKAAEPTPAPGATLAQ